MLHTSATDRLLGAWGVANVQAAPEGPQTVGTPAQVGPEPPAPPVPPLPALASGPECVDVDEQAPHANRPNTAATTMSRRTPTQLCTIRTTRSRRVSADFPSDPHRTTARVGQ
jgi:hypothetical protein